MYYWVPYPFIRLTNFFILGIVASALFDGNATIAFPLFFLFSTFFFIFFWRSLRRFFYYYSFFLGLLAFVILFLAGYLRFYQYAETNDGHHLANIKGELTHYRAVVVKETKENNNSFSTEVEIKTAKINDKWQKATGKAIIFSSKEDAPYLFYGDYIFVSGSLNVVKGPLNPAAFDYKSYLKYKNIYHTGFISAEELIVYGNKKKRGVFYYANSIQQACAKVINENISDPEARGIILALVLGIKDNLEDPLRDAYATAGVMHILAVSGLHVGIIYLVLVYTLSWLKKGKLKWLFSVISLLVLWLYAFVTGLSPSVLRAVTMFSFLIIAEPWKKQTDIYNTIAASAFVLLWINPFFIMAVGFQLSYVAVLGIVYLFPKIYPIFDLKYKIPDMIWKISAVSISAQLAVLPLSIYYFNQLPLYFLLANIVLIPAAFLMLSLGLGLLLLSFFPFVAHLVGSGLEFLVILANQFIYWIGSLPLSQISGLYINGLQVFFLMTFFISLFALVKKRRFYWMVLATLIYSAFSGAILMRKFNRNIQKEIIYYSTPRAGVVAFSQGRFHSMITVGGSIPDEESFKYNIQPNLIRKAYNADYATYFPFKKDKDEIQQYGFYNGSILVWNGYKIMVLDKPLKEAWHLKEKVAVDLLILENNALLSLELLSSRLQFKQLIIGNSYKYNQAYRLIKEAKAVNLNFCHPLSEGALVIKI